jgi:ferrous iron transport protein B
MATRILHSPKERLATLLTVPFMNCGAKLPVFALLIAAFFSENEATVMFIVTLIAWAGALLAAKLLRSTVIKGPATPFVMELPPYRVPTFKGLMIHTWERTWQYIKKAGTVILGIAILLWAMMSFPSPSDAELTGFERARTAITAETSPETVGELESAENGAALSAEARQLRDRLRAVDRAEAEAGLRSSVAGRIGTALETVTRLAGFDWRTNIALIGGFAAKEVVVSTLGTAYSLGETDPEKSEPLSETLSGSPGWSPLAAWSLIIFTIFYAPCFVAVVCIAREAGSWKWGAFSIVFNTAIAFTAATLVYQAGSALGF